MPPLRQFRVITQSLRMSHAACSTSRQPAGWHKYLQSVAKKEINECEHYFFGLSLKLSFNRLSSCFHSCQTEPRVNCVSLSITYIGCYSLLILSIHQTRRGSCLSPFLVSRSYRNQFHFLYTEKNGQSLKKAQSSKCTIVT